MPYCFGPRGTPSRSSRSIPLESPSRPRHGRACRAGSRRSTFAWTGGHRRPGLGHQPRFRRHEDLRGRCASARPTSSCTAATPSTRTVRSRPRSTLHDGRVWRNIVTPEKSKVAETLAEFRGNYAYNLLDENVRAFNAEVPQIGQWDDHEITNNWSRPRSSPTPRYTEKSVPLLAARAGRRSSSTAPAPGTSARPERVLSLALRRGPLLDVFLLDERSYRGAERAQPRSRAGADAEFLGRDAARLAQAAAARLHGHVEGARQRPCPSG